MHAVLQRICPKLALNSSPPILAIQTRFALLGLANTDSNICYAAEVVESLKPRSIVVANCSGNCRLGKDLRIHLDLQRSSWKSHLKHFHSYFQPSKGYDSVSCDEECCLIRCCLNGNRIS